MNTYAIQGGVAGARRLGMLAEIMAPTTLALLHEIGLSEGERCLDLGCGAGQATLAMARLVGPTGMAVGIDMDSIKLASAREQATHLGLSRAEFRRADVREWSEAAVYDCVHARFLLSHVTDRRAILDKMRRALRPGGVLIVEDIELAGALCYPESPAFTRYCALYRELNRRCGGDADLGPKLYGLVVETGIEGVRQRISQPVHVATEEGKMLHLSTLENIAEAALAERLISAAELDTTLAELDAFTRDPRSMLALPRIFQVWGRTPAA